MDCVAAASVSLVTEEPSFRQLFLYLKIRIIVLNSLLHHNRHSFDLYCTQRHFTLYSTRNVTLCTYLLHYSATPTQYLINSTPFHHAVYHAPLTRSPTLFLLPHVTRSANDPLEYNSLV